MLNNVKEMAKRFENVEAVRKKIRSVQSQKSRLKKQKGREDYDEKMTEILKEEQLLKEVREYFEPKKTPVPEMTEEDIELLDYDETLRAIKSIQSKKCLSQHLTEDITKNVEYNKACEVEELLLDHKDRIKPIEETVVRKSDIRDLAKHIENCEQDVDKDYIIEQLLKLTK